MWPCVEIMLIKWFVQIPLFAKDIGNTVVNTIVAM